MGLTNLFRGSKKGPEADGLLHDPERRRSYDEVVQRRGMDAAKRMKHIAKSLKESGGKILGVRAGRKCTRGAASVGADDARHTDVEASFEKPSVDKRSQSPLLSESPTASRSVVPSGTLVVVRALKRPRKYDGLIGCVSGWSESKHKYSVQLHCGGSLSLTPCHITQLCAVTLYGLQYSNKPELNNRSGKIVGIDVEEDRYIVRVDGELEALPPKNCILPRGTAVTVVESFNEDYPPEMRMAEVIDVYGSLDMRSFKYVLRYANGATSDVAAGDVLC